MGFTRKLQLSFAIMVAITLGVAWYFYDSAQWFSSDTQDLANAAALLSDYQQVATNTYRALHAVESAVAQGAGTVVTDLDAAAGSSREAFSRIRAEDPEEAAPTLDELESATQDVFRSLLLVDAALERSQADLVEQEMARLFSEGAVSRFDVLIEQAIEERQTALMTLREEAVSLADYIVRLLPSLMFVFVALSGFVAWRLSRGLSHSLGTLQEATREFALGNLAHKVPDLDDWEFRQLAVAFDHMASQVAKTEAELRDSNVRLEAKVDERTRALKSSNEKLARLDDHRRKFLADISHEFRTPLTVIRGESEIALRRDTHTVADYREALQRIIETADHATSLVEDLLFIVRADAGEPRLKIEPVRVTRLLGDVCSEFGGKARQQGVDIEFLGGPEDATLEGDQRRLRQVFSILLDNALRYSEPGGEVRVGAQRQEDGLVVEIRDRGIGLSPDEASQAFDRFFRGRKALVHAEQGTGLGLSVAKAIVEAHGGDIELRPRQGSGAVATVRLPLGERLRVVA